MAALSHAQAVKLLRENTRRYTNGVIQRPEWDREVERILDLRFPDERARRAVPGDEWIDLANASRTSSTPDTRPFATDRILDPAGDPLAVRATQTHDVPALP